MLSRVSIKSGSLALDLLRWVLQKLGDCLHLFTWLRHHRFLRTLVPKFGDVKEHVPTKLTYDQVPWLLFQLDMLIFTCFRASALQVAAQSSPSWFNMNPAHCLRSKYFHKHEPPCYYLIQGREHVLRKNALTLVASTDRMKTKIVQLVCQAQKKHCSHH